MSKRGIPDCPRLSGRDGYRDADVDRKESTYQKRDDCENKLADSEAHESPATLGTV